MARGSIDVLVEVPCGAGTAAVYRAADGSVWLTSERGSGGPRVESYGAHCDAWAGQMVVGGLLPPGAVDAQVVDAIGTRHPVVSRNNAWLAVIERSPFLDEPAVLYTDANDEVVRAPLPAGVAPEALTDADAPCPACGAREWETVTSIPSGRYVGLELGRRVAALCAHCGHEQRIGGVLRGGSEEADPEGAAAFLREQRAEERALLERIAFAVYELTGWDGPRHLAGKGGPVRGPNAELEHPTALTLAFGEPASGTPWARVTTDSDPKRYQEERELAFQALIDALPSSDAMPPIASDAAIFLWFAWQARDELARAARARTSTREVPVDGRAVPFTVMEAEGCVGAAAMLEDAGITIAGELDLAKVRIQRTRDLGAYTSDGGD